MRAAPVEVFKADHYQETEGKGEMKNTPQAAARRIIVLMRARLGPGFDRDRIPDGAEWAEFEKLIATAIRVASTPNP